MGVFDETYNKAIARVSSSCDASKTVKVAKPAPGDVNYPAGVSSFQVHAKGCHKEVTLHRDVKGNVTAAFIRNLFLGFF